MRVYQKPKIVGRLSGSNSPPLIWCSWWEMLFPFFVFHSFSILWLSARAKLMSPVSSPAHHTTFIPFIPYIYDYLTFSVKSHVWKTYSSDFKAPFWHFHKKSKIVVIPLLFISTVWKMFLIIVLELTYIFIRNYWTSSYDKFKFHTNDSNSYKHVSKLEICHN